MRNLWINVGVGIVGVVTAIAAVRGEMPGPRPPRAASTPSVAAMPGAAPSVSPSPVAPSAPSAPVSPSPAESSRASQAPATSSVPRGDGEQVRTWLLTLPDSEFASLVGTEQLDRAIAQVVNGLSLRTADGTAEREIDDFLSRINARVLAVADSK